MDRRSRLAASILVALTAVSIWLSAGTLAVVSTSGGDTTRIAALPSIWLLFALIAGGAAVAMIAKLRLPESWPLAISGVLWLPFLPGHVPAAFLIWQGPIEWIVWLVVLAGLVAARAPRLTPLFSNPSRAPIVAGLVVAVASFAAFTRVPDAIPGGDEPHYLAATQSLIKDFDLRVSNNYSNGDYLQYFPGRLEPHFLKRSTSGEIYSIHAPGVSVIVLPAFALAGYTGAVLTVILFAALTAALTWTLVNRIAGAAGAWCGTAAVFVTAPYFFHTFTIYPEIIGSFCVMCAAWLLIELDEGRHVSPATLIAVSGALAVMPWLHSRFAVIAALMGAFVFVRLVTRTNGWRDGATFIAVPAIAAVAWFGFFWVIWGSPSPTAPYGADTSTSLSYVVRGLIGLAVDQQFGVLSTAPVYVAAIAGFWIWFRRRPRLAIECAVVVIVYAVAVASYAMWWAGSAAPARFLVAILPLAAIPIGLAANSVTAIGLLISVALIVPRALVEGGRLIFNGRSTFDATVAWMSRAVDLTQALPSVHRDGGTIAVRDALIWLALIALAAVAASILKRGRELKWTVTALSFAVATMVAATMTWRLHHSTASTGDAGKLAAFAELRPWHATFVDVSHGQATASAQFLQALEIAVPNGTSRIDRIPAGEYRVSGVMPWRMRVGRNDNDIELTGERLRIPVMLQSPVIRSESLRLAPEGIVATPLNRNAIHAAQFGGARAFFFDEHAYAEKDGFWMRGDSEATVLIEKPEPARSELVLSVIAGLVPTTIEVSTRGWRQSLSLDAGQKQEVIVPPTTGNDWVLSIRSGAGFRPSEREPGNRDVRLLAAWIAVLR